MQDAMETTKTPTAPVYISHPCTAPFPAMSTEEEAEFIADIARNGLREAIIIDQHNRIVDGVHRYRACLKLGMTPIFDQRTLTDQEAWALSFSLNFHRRHMSEATRAAVSAEVRRSANLPLTQAEAAKAFNISERTQRSAEAVLDASPDLHRAVKEDKLSVHAAENIAKLPQPHQAEAIDKVKKGDIKGAKTLAKAARSETPKKLKDPDRKVPKPIAKAATSPEANKTVTPKANGQKSAPPRKPPSTLHAVYAPLFQGVRELVPQLDELPNHLGTHPLTPRDAQDLLAELQKLPERVERAVAQVRRLCLG